MTPFFDSWNGPTIIKVSEIGKETTLTVQNLTSNTVNLLNSSALETSSNINIYSQSNCNNDVNPFEHCDLTFTLDDDQDGYIKLKTKKNTFIVAVEYESTKPNENFKPLKQTNGSGNGGGALNYYVLIFLFVTLFLRSSFYTLKVSKIL